MGSVGDTSPITLHFIFTKEETYMALSIAKNVGGSTATFALEGRLDIAAHELTSLAFG